MKSPSFVTRLAILQQSEYELPRYQRWLDANSTSNLEIQPKKWTLKLRLLYALCFILPLPVALLLLEIPKRLIIHIYVLLATRKLRSLQAKGLCVVAIAGSYGKTSTKYIANHVLSQHKKIVMTPENINTPIGIARFILSDLNSTYQIFLAELGEYYPGDIAGLVNFLQPEYKILTPVGFAHLERFKTKESLQKSLEELVTTDPKRGKNFVYGNDDEKIKK